MTPVKAQSSPLGRAILAGPPRVFLTGPRRVGKSSLVRAVLAQGHHACGFLVLRIEAARTSGYDLVLLPQGARLALARRSWQDGLRFGEWRFRREIFEETLVQHLDRCTAPGRLTVLDELGFVERNSEPFRAAVARVLMSPGPLLGVVQLRALPHWLPLLRRADVPLVYLSESNRSDWQRILFALFGRVAAAGRK